MKVYVNPQKASLEKLTKRPTVNAQNLSELAEKVFFDVKTDGDLALRRYTQAFDKVRIDSVVMEQAEIRTEADKLALDVRAAIDQAYENIWAFHVGQLGDISTEVETQPGVICWREVRPIERVGLYVPGGSAPLVSTVLMLGVPAQQAGCSKIVLASPPSKSGDVSAAICYAALKVGVTQLIRVGGMQAIAAMTFGTESVQAVDKLFGPGNQYVMAAKQYAQRFNVAIDMPAGPSEVLVVADSSANPAFVAADLLSQAEHGPDSQVVLLTTDKSLVPKVMLEVKNQLKTLSRGDVAKRALENSFCIVYDTTQEAIDFANDYAPEHIILSVKNAKLIAQGVKNAGSVFLGNYSPESAGDYASGTNHTLPTNGWARSYGGLSVESFVKKITFQRLTKAGLKGLQNTIETLAIAEGLDAHKQAVSVRFNVEKEK